jgi:hypothetical protein
VTSSFVRPSEAGAEPDVDDEIVGELPVLAGAGATR